MINFLVIINANYLNYPGLFRRADQVREAILEVFACCGRRNPANPALGDDVQSLPLLRPQTNRRPQSLILKTYLKKQALME